MPVSWSHMRAAVELMRPLHWVKNGFVLTGLLFGHAWNDAAVLYAVLGATAAFCLASSAVYAFNDSMDAASDRRHPRKRTRPVARGALGVRAARAIAAIAGVAALALAAASAPGTVAWVLAYLAVNVGYSLGLRHVPVLDVFLIAGGFMLRLLAGTLGVGIAPSPWLFACGLLLTLFLGFAKRRAELGRLADDAGSHRPVLAAYTPRFLDAAVWVCAGGTLLTYTLYTLSEHTAAVHGTTQLVLTLPWVLLGTFRYLYRLHFRGGGGDPALELLGDPVLAVATLGWLASVIMLLA